MESIVLSLGQAGVQTGSELWKLLSYEHNVLPDGTVAQPDSQDANLSRAPFFYENTPGLFRPRGLFVDLESSVVDNIRKQPHSQMFSSGQYVSGKEDGAYNFAMGMYTLGKDLLDRTLEAVRKQVEACDQLEAFQFIHSLGGGTGSGYSALLMRKLMDHYPKYLRLNYSIFPSTKFPSSSTEDYNAGLSFDHLQRQSDAVFAYDNHALYSIAHSMLQVDSPSFSDINQLIAHSISSITAPSRFDLNQRYSLTELVNHLTVQAKYMLPSHAPWIAAESKQDSIDLEGMTEAALENKAMMAGVPLSYGRLLSSAWLYRGDTTIPQLCNVLDSTKRLNNYQFVNNRPLNFFCSLTSQPMGSTPTSIYTPSSCSVTHIANTTAFGDLFDRIRSKFESIYSRRAFVYHLVGQGLEDQELTDSLAMLGNLVSEYATASSGASVEAPQADAPRLLSDLE